MRDSGDPNSVFDLLPADLTIYALGSLLAARWSRSGDPRTPTAAWLVTGGTLYATLHCMGTAGLGGGSWLAVALMVPSSAGSLVCAVIAGRLNAGAGDDAIYRIAREAGPLWNIVKTLGQIVIFWGSFLVLFPLALSTIERAAGLPAFEFPAQRLLASGFFLLGGAIALWSAWVMATVGQGTPLPLDQTRRLVVRGPYRYVRNPMAIAGPLQGIAVGLALGSPTAMLYAALGWIAWECAARPSEEHDLEARFGPAYVRYKNNVDCWRPRWRPWSEPEDDLDC